MINSASQELVTPATDLAQIVFVRSSFVGGAIQAALFDVSTSEPELIGILSNGKKIAYMVDPGEHVFMVVSEAADFLEANLEGGKTYFAMVTPRMGVMSARFSLQPVRNGASGEFQYQSDEFQRWLEVTELVANTPASNAWAAENISDVRSKRAEYWEVWQQRTLAALAERTLNPDDGI